MFGSLIATHDAFTSRFDVALLNSTKNELSNLKLTRELNTGRSLPLSLPHQNQPRVRFRCGRGAFGSLIANHDAFASRFDAYLLNFNKALSSLLYLNFECLLASPTQVDRFRLRFRIRVNPELASDVVVGHLAHLSLPTTHSRLVSMLPS